MIPQLILPYIEGSSLAGSRARRTSRLHGVCRCTSLAHRGIANCRRAPSRLLFVCRKDIGRCLREQCRIASVAHMDKKRLPRVLCNCTSHAHTGIGRCLRAQRSTPFSARKGISYAPPCLFFFNTGDITRSRLRTPTRNVDRPSSPRAKEEARRRDRARSYQGASVRRARPTTHNDPVRKDRARQREDWTHILASGAVEQVQ